MQTSFVTPPRFKAELRASLLMHSATESPARAVPVTHRRVGRRVAPAFALALVLLAATLIISLGGRGGLAPQGASAKGVLNASAGAIDQRGPSLSLAHGGYFYSRSLTWFRYAWAGTRQSTVSGVSEEWVARNGSGRQRFGVLMVTGRPATGLGAAGHSSDTSLRAYETPFPLSLAVANRGIGLSYSQLRALPADPRGLTQRVDGLVARELRDYHRVRGTWRRQLEAVLRFDALRGIAESPSPPQVRAAVYRALALTPGIRLLGRRSDSGGRVGMAVMVRVGAVELVLIIDPTTGALLQSSRRLLHRSNQMAGWPAGLVNRTTYLASGIVRSTHARVR
jgi:hypothetical protein